MGRKKLTDEQRRESVPEDMRIDLVVAQRRRHDAEVELRLAHNHLSDVIKKAVHDGASYRAVGIVLGLPHQTVHQLVKPYKR